MSIHTVQRAFNHKNLFNETNKSKQIIKKSVEHRNLFTHLGYLISSLISLFQGRFNKNESRDVSRMSEVFTVAFHVQNNLPSWNKISLPSDNTKLSDKRELDLFKNATMGYKIILRERIVYIKPINGTAEQELFQIKNKGDYYKLIKTLHTVIEQNCNEKSRNYSFRDGQIYSDDRSLGNPQEILSKMINRENLSQNAIAKYNEIEQMKPCDSPQKTLKSVFHNLKAYYKYYTAEQKENIIAALQKLGVNHHNTLILDDEVKQFLVELSDDSDTQSKQAINNWCSLDDSLQKILLSVPQQLDLLGEASLVTAFNDTYKNIIILGRVVDSDLKDWKFTTKDDGFQLIVKKEYCFKDTVNLDEIIGVPKVNITYTYDVKISTNKSNDTSPYEETNVTYKVDHCNV